MTTMTAEEAAWLAGFLDGEGSFQIWHVSSKRDRHVRSTSVGISVSQAAPRDDILRELAARHGGSVSSHGTERRNAKHNASFRWLLTGPRAADLCRAMLPYLRLKRRQAELVIEHQATKAPSHVGARRGRPRAELRVPPEIMARRDAQMAELRTLNARGVTGGTTWQ